MSYDTVKTKLMEVAERIIALKDYYAAATISFDAVTKRINDTAAGLVFLVKDDVIVVAGSTSNNGTFTVADGGHTDYLVVAETLVTEAAGDNVTITSPTHVYHGDYSAFDKGIGNFLVLNPGPVGEGTRQGGGTIIETWTLYGDLFIKYTSESDTWAALASIRSLLIYEFRRWPQLNSTTGILQVKVSCPDDVQGVFDKTGNAGPFWLTQRLVFVVSDRAALSGGEIP
jgi:hypothetical protein